MDDFKAEFYVSSTYEKVGNFVEPMVLDADDIEILSYEDKFKETILEKFPIFFKGIFSENYDDIVNSIDELIDYLHEFFQIYVDNPKNKKKRKRVVM